MAKKKADNPKVVYKIEEGVNPHSVEATTYQMRNFYRQFNDGFFSVLDTMNYIQHAQIVRMMRKGERVLDVCCGRGLLLPMLRYYAKDIKSYTGVDIDPSNATWVNQRVTDGKPIIKDEYYPFKTDFVESNVAQMAQKLLPRNFSFIVYTSSIEHMHKEMGQQSLIECRAVSQPGALMVLTCPNTPEDQDGYNTQYKAHVYEWKRSELVEGLRKAGFMIMVEYGLYMDRKSLFAECERIGLTDFITRIDRFIPPDWYIPMISTLFPKKSKEIAFICKAI